MLNHISIRHFAIVEELSLDLQSGMTVLTGETGAGKSILLDALNLALGDRADINNIRHGEDRAEISVQFTINKDSAAYQWLNEQALDQEDDCLIRRVISREGRSRGFINGSPVPMQSLKELGEMLVDIHGQHEHQSLLKRDIQRQLLDECAGNQSLLLDVQKHYRLWRQKNQQLDELQQSASDRQARIELLSYQLKELDSLNLSDNELQELPEEQMRLANAEKLRNTVQLCLHDLYESDSNNTHQQLSNSIRSLQELVDFDPGLQDIIDMLNNAAIQIQESSDDMRNYMDGIEQDPQRLTIVDERLGLIHDLSRKHQIKPEEIPALHQQLEQEFKQLKSSDQDLSDLEKELTAIMQQYQTLAKQLSKQRAKAATKLNKSVTEIIRELGMPSIEFEVLLESTENELPSISGFETVEFMISPNPGQPQKPLRKIASGGELSRISLAIQTVLADSTHIATLIYDEVDAGIGGPTAEVVGKKLRLLGQNRQVMSVTHLAQVAAQAHHHMKVSKQSDKKSTTSSIELLESKARIEETARMLGGIELTEQSLSHAKEMIDSAQAKKKSRKRA